MTHAALQAPRVSVGHRASPIELTLLGAGWLSIAATLSYVVLATPIVSRLILSGEIASRGGAVSLLAAAMTAAIPVSLAIAGVARLSDAFRIALEPRPGVLLRVAGRLGTGAPHASFAFPSGRPLPAVAVGRFGAVVFRPAPGDSSVRRCGDVWEVDVAGEWMPLELPIRKARLGSGADRAVPTSGHRDFVANVYAAVVAAPHDVDRAPWCAVLEPDQILPYLADMPSEPSRS